MSSPYFVVNSGLSGLGAAPRTENSTRDWLAANPGSTIARQAEAGLQVGTVLASVGGITAAFGIFQLATGKTKSGAVLALLGAAGVAGGLWQNKRTVDLAAGDAGSSLTVGAKPGVAA